MILCIGTTPAAQRVMIFRKLAPDAVNRAATTLDGVAGKSINVAKALKTLGEKPVAITLLGGERGEFLRATLTEKKIETEIIAAKSPTRQCLTMIDEATGTHTELVEESRPVTPAEFKKFMAVVRRQIDKSRAVVMSGTIAPGCPKRFYADCVKLAEKSGALSVVDAQGVALFEALKAKPGLVKPNRVELAATVGRQLESGKDLKSAICELHERGAARVIVTAGKRPALAFDGNHFWRIVSPKIRVANPIGSGDAFTAAVVCRLLRGDDLGEACRWGAAAGAANALTLMPGDFYRTDVNRLLKSVRCEKLK
jgi:1-phosphofructokinase family hexose kinase